MQKVSQVLQNLEKNIQTQEQQITEIYKKKSEELKQSLIKEWQEMQKEIKSNTLKQNQKILKEIEEELKELRTQKNWYWAIGGMIAGIILTIIAFKIIMMMKG